MVQAFARKARNEGPIPSRISMNVTDFLQTLLTTSGRYALTEQDQIAIREHGIEVFTLSKLFSKKFRKWKLDPACIERTEKAVRMRMNAEKPIRLVYFQGGYKLWRFPSSPESDWAEFFNIAYVLQYAAPIAAAYAPGVDVVYYLHTLLMEKHDNLTTEEIHRYGQSFEAVLDQFKKYLPKNMTLTILRDADIYDRDTYFQKLEEGKTLAEKSMRSWPKEKIDDFARMANLNIKWNGKEDWTKLSEREKAEKIHQAALYEEAAISNLPKVFETAKSAENVLLFTRPSPSMIGIGSTYTSIVKHWVGFGVLECDGTRYYPRILSPSQYEKVTAFRFETEAVSGIIAQKNFQRIIIFPQRLKFDK